MFNYLFNRLIYSIPILIVVNIITFALFFLVNTPDDMAKLHLGTKYVSQDEVKSWKTARGYHLPLFFNEKEDDIDKFTQTIFWQKSIKLFIFDFGKADRGSDIKQAIKSRAFPSLALAVPVLIVGLIINIMFALLMVFFRGSYLDIGGVILCIILMSISGLFYIIGGQYLVAKTLKLLPLSGYSDGVLAIKFLLLPIFVSVAAGFGAGGRWYRNFFLEEYSKLYVMTARAKGLHEFKILFSHVLPNALIPILTGIVVLLPSLFMGSLLTESFFGIPGLGSYTIDAIQSQDFAIVRSMVFLGAVLYIIGLMLTDISYMLVDPRIRLR